MFILFLGTLWVRKDKEVTPFYYPFNLYTEFLNN